MDVMDPHTCCSLFMAQPPVFLPRGTGPPTVLPQDIHIDQDHLFVRLLVKAPSQCPSGASLLVPPAPWAQHPSQCQQWVNTL
jgi:hypothetical protein